MDEYDDDESEYTDDPSPRRHNSGNRNQRRGSYNNSNNSNFHGGSSYHQRRTNRAGFNNPRNGNGSNAINNDSCGPNYKVIPLPTGGHSFSIHHHHFPSSDNSMTPPGAHFQLQSMANPALRMGHTPEFMVPGIPPMVPGMFQMPPPQGPIMPGRVPITFAPPMMDDQQRMPLHIPPMPLQGAIQPPSQPPPQYVENISPRPVNISPVIIRNESPRTVAAQKSGGNVPSGSITTTAPPTASATASNNEGINPDPVTNMTRVQTDSSLNEPEPTPASVVEIQAAAPVINRSLSWADELELEDEEKRVEDVSASNSKDIRGGGDRLGAVAASQVSETEGPIREDFGSRYVPPVVTLADLPPSVLQAQEFMDSCKLTCLFALCFTFCGLYKTCC